MSKRVTLGIIVIGLLLVTSASLAQQNAGVSTYPSLIPQISSGLVLLPTETNQSFGGVIPYNNPNSPITVYRAVPQAPYIPPPSWANIVASADQGALYPPETERPRAPASPWPQRGATMAQVMQVGSTRWTASISGLLSQDYTNATGTVSLWLDPAGLLHYQVEVNNLRNMTEITISFKNVNLPPEIASPVAYLYSGHLIGGRFRGVIAQGTLTAKALAGWLEGYQVADLIQGLNQDLAFVTVRTTQHPQGELMGDISPVPASPATPPVQAGVSGDKG